MNRWCGLRWPSSSGGGGSAPASGGMTRFRGGWKQKEGERQRESGMGGHLCLGGKTEGDGHGGQDREMATVTRIADTCAGYSGASSVGAVPLVDRRLEHQSVFRSPALPAPAHTQPPPSRRSPTSCQTRKPKPRSNPRRPSNRDSSFHLQHDLPSSSASCQVPRYTARTHTTREESGQPSPRSQTGRGLLGGI